MSCKALCVCDLCEAVLVGHHGDVSGCCHTGPAITGLGCVTGPWDVVCLTGTLSHTATPAATWWGLMGVPGCGGVFACHSQVWSCLPVPHPGGNMCDVAGCRLARCMTGVYNSYYPYPAMTVAEALCYPPACHWRAHWPCVVCSCLSVSVCLPEWLCCMVSPMCSSRFCPK